MKIIQQWIPIQDPSPVKKAFKTVIRSIVYGGTKIEFLTFQNNRVFLASAFWSVQLKSNKEYSENSVF